MPETKATVVWTKSLRLGSSPVPMSLAPPPLAAVGMPETMPRSMTFDEAWTLADFHYEMLPPRDKSGMS